MQAYTYVHKRNSYRFQCSDLVVSASFREDMKWAKEITQKSQFHFWERMSVEEMEWINERSNYELRFQEKRGFAHLFFGWEASLSDSAKQRVECRYSKVAKPIYLSVELVWLKMCLFYYFLHTFIRFFLRQFLRFSKKILMVPVLSWAVWE